MGYRATGHNNRVNYYSNPRVTFPATRTPTGTAGLADNAAKLTMERSGLPLTSRPTAVCCRFAIAACGTDELDGACYDCTVSPAAESCRE